VELGCLDQGEGREEFKKGREERGGSTAIQKQGHVHDLGWDRIQSVKNRKGGGRQTRSWIKRRDGTAWIEEN